MQHIHFLKMYSLSKEKNKISVFCFFNDPLVVEAMVKVVGLSMVTELMVAETIVTDAMVNAAIVTYTIVTASLVTDAMVAFLSELEES